jgi:aminopeptidase N
MDANSIGKRSLKNLCLGYLMHLNTDDVFDLCLLQLKQADNLSDTLTCLVALSNSKHPEKEQILEKYYEKWQHQPNLVNKWLSINATIKLPETLQHIQKLMLHPAFNIKNPNKVYALLRTFAQNNHINFHTIDGSGYKFLADQVIAIDKFNPQLAARITTPLMSGDKLDKTRQELLRQQLLRISQEPESSKNVFELVNKALTKSPIA